MQYINVLPYVIAERIQKNFSKNFDIFVYYDFVFYARAQVRYGKTEKSSCITYLLLVMDYWFSRQTFESLTA